MADTFFTVQVSCIGDDVSNPIASLTSCVLVNVPEGQETITSAEVLAALIAAWARLGKPLPTLPVK